MIYAVKIIYNSVNSRQIFNKNDIMVWKNTKKQTETEGHFAFERIKARKVRFTSVLLFLRAPLSLNNMGKAVLKSQSLGLRNKLEIKEGNPAKDFQQGDPPNICLNSFQIVG